MKYEVKLTATFTATVTVECYDEDDAATIAENAWRPLLEHGCTDPTIDAVVDYDIPYHAETVTAIDVEPIFPPRPIVYDGEEY